MAKPNSRATLVSYCKRALGHPVIEINVDDDQVDDRIDEALQFYQEYHADAIEKVYLKPGTDVEIFEVKEPSGGLSFSALAGFFDPPDVQLPINVSLNNTGLLCSRP